MACCPAILKRAAPRVAALCALLASPAALAETVIYSINSAGIYRINTSNSVATTITTAAPFGTATFNAMDHCPNGLIYFVSNGANPTVYQYNPYTPSIAPVALSTSMGAGVTGLLRMACSPTTGKLYAMAGAAGTLYEVNKTTGAVISTITVTLPSTNAPSGGSGDIAFDAAGTLYYAGDATPPVYRLYTIAITGATTATMTHIGQISGTPLSTTVKIVGLAFSNTGTMYLAATTQTQIYTAPSTGGTLTAIGATGATTALTDLGSTELTPDVRIVKSDSIPGIAPGQSTTYVITATNDSPFAVTTTVQDTLPATLTGATWTCTPSAGSSCAAASGSGTINTTATLLPAGTATYLLTATVAAGATGTIPNTATAALPFTFMVDTTPANNSATDTNSVTPPTLTATKISAVVSDPLNGTTNPKRIPGAFVDYTISVSNSSAGFVDNNTTVFTDAIPANTSLFVQDLVAGAGPLEFTQGTPSSTLAYSYVALNNAGDSLSFSNDNGVTYGYMPTANASGVDPSVTHVRVSLAGKMAANSNFAVRFRTVIK